MKKFISIALIFILSLSLVACGKDNTSEIKNLDGTESSKSNLSGIYFDEAARNYIVLYNDGTAGVRTDIVNTYNTEWIWEENNNIVSLNRPAESQGRSNIEQMNMWVVDEGLFWRGYLFKKIVSNPSVIEYGQFIMYSEDTN